MFFFDDDRLLQTTGTLTTKHNTLVRLPGFVFQEDLLFESGRRGL